MLYMEDTLTNPKCPNCESEVAGNYCHFCGQKYHDHKETFGELVYEFFSDFTHWDSRFIKTILPLLLNPGKISIEYINGKRKSQFHPIRLYIFSSFVYFLLIFSCGKTNQTTSLKLNNSKDSTSTQIVNDSSDTSVMVNKEIVISPLGKIIVKNNDDSTAVNNYIQTKPTEIESLVNAKTSPEAYLSWQKSLPREQQHGFWKKHTYANFLKLNPANSENLQDTYKKIGSAILHNIPRMMFFLLPLFALLMKMLYFKHRKFYYADFAVIALHYFSFVFVILMLLFLLSMITDSNLPKLITVLWIFVYLFLLLKRIFAQRFLSTFIKYSVLVMLCLFMFTIAFLINAVLSTVMA